VFTACGTWHIGNRTGRDLPNTTTNTATREDCLAHCLRTPFCNAVSYANDTRCFPKVMAERDFINTDTAAETYRMCEPGTCQPSVPCCSLSNEHMLYVLSAVVWKAQGCDYNRIWLIQLPCYINLECVSRKCCQSHLCKTSS
jgi:hypothetical protein